MAQTHSLFLALSFLSCVAPVQPIFAVEHFGPFEVDGYASQTEPAGGDRLRVRFSGGVEWPHVVLRERTASGIPGNPALATTLVLPVENPGDLGVDLLIRVGDDANATWPDHAIATHQFIAPHSATHLIVALAPHDAHQMGMQDPPPPMGASAAGSTILGEVSGHFAGSTLASLYLVVWGQSGPRTLIVGEPKLASFDWGPAAYTHLIDRYGQFTRGTWPGKVLEDADLKRAAQSEAAFMTQHAQHSVPVDAYGGFIDGPAFTPSGWFRTAQDAAGRWWFVTPSGHVFFSLGVNTIAISDGRTFVADREFMFDDLGVEGGDDAMIVGTAPPAEGIAGRMPRFNQGRWVNFYAANLRRRLGPAYASAWPNEVLGRLRAWGFNTIGNWSAPALWQAHRLPYTVPITAEGAFDRISGAADGVADFPDPFSPGWPAAIENALTRLGVASRDDPWLLGYFVDNELPWGDGASKDPRRRFALVLRVLAQAGSPPAKQALIAHMKERYRSSEQWAAAWAIPSVSWETLASQPLVPPGALSQAALDDLAALSTLFAQTYYRTVALSLKRADPRHLYLGSRFAAQTPEALSACEKWCDVVSFNVYSGAFEAARLDRFDTLSKPALVGEFNFSSTDSGPFGHGLVNLASESDRAAAYSAYVRAAAADFSVIGVHWFQYLDEPAAGRLLDGENAHFGLVSVTDTPYIGFMASVRAANRGIFSIREELRPTAEGPTGLGRCAALASTESSPCD